MPRCKNPECGKEIPEGFTYCPPSEGEDTSPCLKQHLELKQTRRKKAEVETLDYERQTLLKSIGFRVELQMSRGPPVRGILRNFDPQYAKLAVEEDLENGRTRLTFVRFNYVSALSIIQKKGMIKEFEA